VLNHERDEYAFEFRTCSVAQACRLAAIHFLYLYHSKCHYLASGLKSEFASETRETTWRIGFHGLHTTIIHVRFSLLLHLPDLGLLEGRDWA
jgi:hypothetical protein